MSRWRAEVDFLAYRLQLQGYCWVHDSHRWAWTHRHCARRNHEIGAQLARIIKGGTEAPPWGTPPPPPDPGNHVIH